MSPIFDVIAIVLCSGSLYRVREMSMVGVWDPVPVFGGVFGKIWRSVAASVPLTKGSTGGFIFQ